VYKRQVVGVEPDPVVRGLTNDAELARERDFRIGLIPGRRISGCLLYTSRCV